MSLFLFSCTNSSHIQPGAVDMTRNQAAQANAEQAKLFRLPNALSVLVIPDERFPLASLRLYVHAGSAYETDAQAGISHLLEHMVFKGTPRRPKGQISKEVEELGGYLNAATSFDYTVYIVDVPSNHFAQGLDILHDMVFNADINREELEAEKKVVLSELERNEDSPGNYMFQQIGRHALADTPYERPIIGFRETVSTFTKKDITDYIATWYQPQSMLLVVCGKVDVDDVLKEAEKLFGKMKNTNLWAPPASIDPAMLRAGSSDAHPIAPKIMIEKRPLNKIYFNAAIPVPGYTSDQDPALELFAHMLGGDKTSLLYRKYKYDKQLVDDISAYYYNFERVGLIYFDALLDADKFESFWAEFCRELPAVKATSFTEDELARAKLNIEDDLFRSKETISGLASKAGTFYFRTGSLNGERDYLNNLLSVSLDDIENVINLWFSPEALSIVALTPEEYEAPDLGKTLEAAWPASATRSQSDGNDAIAAGVEVIELDKDRKLILIPDSTLPYVSMSLAFTGGDLLINQNEQGLNDLAAATLTKGTAQMSAPEMQVYLSERAAGLSASAGKKVFTVGSTFPVQFKNDMLGLINDVLAKPAFSAEEVEREKSSQIASILAREDQPLGLAFRRLMPFLFPQQVQGFYRMGEPDQVKTYTAAQVKEFWKKQVAQPWVMAVCGQFNREEMIAFAKSLPIPQTSTPAMPDAVWTAEKELGLHMPGRNQSHVLVVFETVSSISEDNPKLEILNTYLSGMGGLLFTELRDKQSLGYSVTSIKWQSEQTGLMAFYIGTEPEKTEIALDGFKKIIHQLQTQPLQQTDLEGAANQMEGEYFRGHQSLGSRASEAAGLAILNYPLDYSLKNIEAARKVTPKEIQEVARKYLIWDKAYVVRVDP